MNPIVIDPKAFYTERDLVKALGLTDSTLHRARKFDGLRAIRRGHLVLYRGSDLLEWLTPDEAREPVGAA